MATGLPTLAPKFATREVLARGVGLVRVADDLIGLFRVTVLALDLPERLLAIKLPPALAVLASYPWAEHRLLVQEPVKGGAPCELLDWLAIVSYIGGDDPRDARWFLTRHTLAPCIKYWRSLAEAQVNKKAKTGAILKLIGGHGTVKACTLCELLCCPLPGKKEDDTAADDVVSCAFDSWDAFFFAIGQGVKQFPLTALPKNHRTPVWQITNTMQSDLRTWLDDLSIEVDRGEGVLTTLHCYRAGALEALFVIWRKTTELQLPVKPTWWGPSGASLAILPSPAVCCLAQLFLTDPAAVLADATLDSEDLDYANLAAAALRYLVAKQDERLAGSFMYDQKDGPFRFWLAPLVARLGDVLLLTLTAVVIVNHATWRLKTGTPTARIAESRAIVDTRLDWLLKATKTVIPARGLSSSHIALVVGLLASNNHARIDAQEVVRLLADGAPILIDQLPYSALVQQERRLRELWEKCIVSLDPDRLDVQLDAPLGGPRPDTEDWLERHARQSLVIVPAQYLPLPPDRSGTLLPGEEWPLFICHDEFQHRFTRAGAADAPQLQNLLITDAHAYTVTRLLALLECIDQHIGHRKPSITIRGCPDLLAQTPPREPSLLAMRHLSADPVTTGALIGVVPPLLAARPATPRNYARVVGSDWKGPPPDAARLWLVSESTSLAKDSIDGKRTEPGGGTVVRMTYIAHQLTGSGLHELHVTQMQLDVAFTQDELAMLVYLMQQTPVAVTVHLATPMAGSQSPEQVDMVQYYLHRVQEAKGAPVQTMYWNIWDR